MFCCKAKDGSEPSKKPKADAPAVEKKEDCEKPAEEAPKEEAPKEEAPKAEAPAEEKK